MLHINSHKLMESSQGSWRIYASLVVKGVSWWTLLGTLNTGKHCMCFTLIQLYHIIYKAFISHTLMNRHSCCLEQPWLTCAIKELDTDRTMEEILAALRFVYSLHLYKFYQAPCVFMKTRYWLHVSTVKQPHQISILCNSIMQQEIIVSLYAHAPMHHYVIH